AANASNRHAAAYVVKLAVDAMEATSGIFDLTCALVGRQAPGGCGCDEKRDGPLRRDSFLEPCAGGRQRVRPEKGGAVDLMSGKPLIEDSEVANDETALFIQKRARPGVADEDVRGANVAQSHFVRL